MDLSTVTLRVLVGVAERGSFTAAAVALGYTQSGVSRQVAAAERAAGVRLFERVPAGVRPTSAGRELVRQAAVALDALAAAERHMRGAGSAQPARRVRLGHVPTAGASLVPRALARLAGHPLGVAVTTRETTTPVLVRAVRAGSLDVAVITSRPPHRSPDEEAPPLEALTLTDVELRVAAPVSGPVADALRASRTADGAVSAAALAKQPWVASPSRRDEPLLGVWPGLPGRPRAAHTANDWSTKLALVAAGLALTTVAAPLHGDLPAGVELLRVDGVVPEVRRFSAVHNPATATAPASVAAVLEALAATARRSD